MERIRGQTHMRQRFAKAQFCFIGIIRSERISYLTYRYTTPTGKQRIEQYSVYKKKHNILGKST